MSIIEKLEKFKLSSTENESETEYFKSFSSILNLALVELYNAKPINPVKYLGSYLINESKSSLIKMEMENDHKTQKHFKEDFLKEEQVRKKQKSVLENEIENKKKNKIELISFIKSSSDLEKDFFQICDLIKEVTKSTTVTISYYEQKRRFVNSNEDEFAHLLPENVVRYVGFDRESCFLEHQFIENGEGVTMNLIKNEENEENEKKQEGNNDNNNENDDENTKKISLKTVFIDEVIRNPSVKFFREPKLGCYFALNISYNSSMNKKSLSTSIENLNEYELKKEEIRKKKEEKEKEKAQNEEKDKENQDNSNEKDKENEEIEEEVELKDYEKEEKICILALDTIGQDREFSEEEKEYIILIGNTLKESLYEQERGLLLKERDLIIRIKQKEEEYLQEYTENKVKEEEEKYYKDYLNKKYEESIPIGLSDIDKTTNQTHSRCKYIINQLFENEVLKEILFSIQKLEMTPFERPIQYCFYFLKVNHNEINYPYTNKLDWKKGKSFWKEDVLKKLVDYSPFGPKTEEFDFFSKSNRIFPVFETLFLNYLDEIKRNNIGLGMLVDYLYNSK